MLICPNTVFCERIARFLSFLRVDPRDPFPSPWWKISKNQWKITVNGVPKLFRRAVPPCMQIFSPGDNQEGDFQAIFSVQKSPKKFHTFRKLIIFKFFKPWDLSHRLRRVQKIPSNVLINLSDPLKALFRAFFFSGKNYNFENVAWFSTFHPFQSFGPSAACSLELLARTNFWLLALTNFWLLALTNLWLLALTNFWLLALTNFWL